MYEYIKGRIDELNPAYVVVETSGMGYVIQISLHTYSGLEGKDEATLLLHQVVRDDAHILYGFLKRSERDLFRHLIGVSGVGANTARVILSSFDPESVESAIVQGDVELLKRIKGIGLKTAQRIVVDLKDKLGKGMPGTQLFLSEGNTKRQEALSALVMLGYSKALAEKTLDQLLRQNPNSTAEALIKDALKGL